MTTPAQQTTAVAVLAGARWGLRSALPSACTLSCTLNPVELHTQVMKQTQSLQEATIAANMCQEICNNIRDTAKNRLPVVCELLRLGQLFPEHHGVVNLNRALLGCIRDVYRTLREAVNAMYDYLQCGMLSQRRKAVSTEKVMAAKLLQLIIFEGPLGDVSMHVHGSCGRAADEAERGAGKQHGGCGGGPAQAD